MAAKKIVVTGMGCVTPLGLNVASTWSSMLEGKSGAQAIKQFDSSVLSVNFACEAHGYDPLEYFDRKELRRLDRFNQFGIVASKEAIEQSGLKDSVDPTRVGVLLSSGMGGLNTIQEQMKIALTKPNRVSPFFVPTSIANMLPGQVSLRYGFRGPNFTITSACASSAHSIGEGKKMIEAGDADAMIVGGAESTVCVLAVSGFSNMKALSKRNDDPTKASRPFDKARDGFVMGEGAGVLVIESEESAKARGATIFAELIGYGRNADAYHETSPREDGSSAAACMELAIKDAGIKASDVDHVNTHGTSTPVGDIAESKAINLCFGEHAKSKLLCTSTKSMTGHLLGAAGAVEAIACIQALRESVIPPTINLEDQDPDCAIQVVANEKKAADLNIALSNGFGFGGTNASLIFKRFDQVLK